MKYYCDANEHGEEAVSHTDRPEARYVGMDGDILFLLCEPCLEFYKEDYPLNPYLEVGVGSGGRSIRPKWGEVVPGDVVVLPPIASGEGMRESDPFDGPELALVDVVTLKSDRYVHVTLRTPLPNDERMEFWQNKVTVIAHENGYGTEREPER